MARKNVQGALVLRPKDLGSSRTLLAALDDFSQNVYALPGIQQKKCRECFIEQVFESIHRIEYVARIRARPISKDRSNPGSDEFDPLKAAVLFQRGGHVEDSFWMVFLFVHFGKNAKTGWRMARDVYGALGGQVWTWARVRANPAAFRRWLLSRQVTLEGMDGISRHFGNHRKYQSIDAMSPNGTGAAVESYVNWVGASHEVRMGDAVKLAGKNRRKAFDLLYHSMTSVRSFGRTAKFDYLTMVGKLELAPIEPGSTYMQGATGPVEGARLLLGNNRGALSRGELDKRLVLLGDKTGLSMQVLEDSLCNWQKSPQRFRPFRG